MQTTQDDTAGPVALPIDDLLDEFEKPLEVKQDDGLPAILEGEPKSEEVKTEEQDKPKKAAKSKDDPVAKLKREIEEVRAREAQERQQREQFARFAAQKAREAQAAMARAQTSDYDLASNALDAASDKMGSLEQQLAAAFSEGDGQRVAAIQKQMSILGARITMLEDVKSRLEHQAQVQRQRAQAQAQARQRQQPRQQQGDPFEASISHFSETSKKWIREHRDLVTQPGKWNDVVRYHHVAEDQGLEADTPEYFAFIERKLGLREDDGDVEVVTQKPKRSIPAAPVSRDGVIGGISNRKVTLTPAEIQAAADLNMTKEEYARYKVKALQDGKYDHQQRI